MIRIRTLDEADYAQWLELYRFYAEHYQVTLTPEGLSATWGWLMDAAHPVSGMVAECADRLIGLAHYRAMPSPLRGTNIGFLDDLLVHPEQRGSDAASLLMEELQAIGRQEGWAVIRWITREDNYRARALYDKLASKTNWTLYEM